MLTNMNITDSIKQILDRWYGPVWPQIRKLQLTFADEIKVSLILHEESNPVPVRLQALHLAEGWQVELQS